MGRIGLFIFGYVVFALALLLAAWKLGVLASLGTFWSAIAVLVLLGIGVMLGVSRSGGSRVAIER